MKKKKKALSVLLSLCMVTSMCPPALAEEFPNELNEQIENIEEENIEDTKQKQQEQVDEIIIEEQEEISSKEPINEEVTNKEQNIIFSEEVNKEEDSNDEQEITYNEDTNNEIDINAEENEESRENEEGISSHKSDTDIAYPVTGGNIYFDEATGTITGCDKEVTEAVIPSKINGIDVVGIGLKAFSSCVSLTNIEIPNSVTSIDYEAFSSCSSLTSIEIPNSVTSIGNYAFWNCSNLTSIEIPNSVTSISNYAFLGCSNLTSIEIPNSVISIGDEAFRNCSNLTLIEIPNSVTIIGALAFSGCTNLINIELPNSVTKIGRSAFSRCNRLTNIKLPDSITYIPYRMFEYCNNLKNINLPNSITVVGYLAFFRCNNLTNIKIPDNVTAIGYEAFSECINLTNVEIPDSVTKIGDGVFSGCSNLTSIEIPNSVTEIGEFAFSGCNSLTSIELPNSITTIADSTFASCDSLINIKIPNSVTSIGESAFSDCNSLTSVKIPNSVTSIGREIFRDCINLTNIELPNSITKIDWLAFGDCSNLTNIVIPNSVSYIDSSVFLRCNNLTDIYYTGSEEQWNQIDNKSKEDLESLGVTIHYNYTGNGEDIESSSGNVKFFNDYNEKDKKVFFDNSTLAYSITDNTNMSFASSLDALLNKYVLVSTENGNSNILSIKPVESKIGTVTGVDYSADSKITHLTIDGTKYPVTENMFLVPVSGDSVLLYHIYEGKIVDLDFLVQKTGTLEAWDDSTQTATINGTKYPTNYVSDTTGINQFLGKDINFYINNRTNYIPLMKIIGIADDVEKCNKVSMHESKIDMAENTKKEIRALLIFDKREKNLSWTWTSNNPDIVDFDGQSTLTKSTTETPPVTTSDIVNICGKKVGTATITCTLSDGTKATATVNVETKKALKAKEKLEKELEKWEQSYNEYIQSIEETTKEKAGITVNASSKDEIIANFEKKLSDMGIQIIAESGISEEGKKYVYGALLEMFAEEIKASPKFSTLSMDKNKLPKNIVNEVIKMFRVYNCTKHDGKHSVEINLMNFGGNFGSITYSDSKRIYTIAVVSSVDKMLDVADEFILDLLKLDKNLIDYAYKEVVNELSKELFGKTVDSLKQEAVANKIGKFLDKFKKLGLGDVVEIVNDSYDFYKKVKDVFKNDPDSVINGIKNIKFESKSVNQKVAKKAIDAMEKARKNICKYIEEYFKNGGTISSKKGVRSLIQCPVDVDIFDNIGNMIAYVHDDGNIWYAENAEDIVEINIIGDAKEIYSGEEDIHLKITATDEGVLNCIFEQLSDDEFVKRINYYDIELYEGKEVTAAITNESNEEESNVDVQVEVQESGREIPADEIVTQSNQVTISCIMEDSSAGEVIGGGTYTAGDMATVRATSKEGYHFLGWKNSDDMLVSTSHIYIFTAKENDTLKAIFTKDIFIDDSVDYTITFDSGDGSGTMDSITAHDGEIIKLPDCTFTAPTNKEFKAWFIDDAEYDEGDNFIVAADNVAYAIWKDKTATPPSPSIPSNKYIIAYNSNGGSGEMKSDTAEQGKEFTLPNCTFTAPDGKEFKAWKIDDKEYAPNDTYLFTNDTTVYAVWKEIDASTYTITFDANGGTVNQSTMITQNDGTLSSLPTPTRNGYTFKGWYTSVNGGVKVNENEVYSKDTTLYAQWESKTQSSSSRSSSGSRSSSTVYDITIPTTNGGTITVDPKSASHGRTVSIIATPNAGYELFSIKVIDSNKNKIDLTTKDNKQYIFTMPNSTVEINAEFKAISNSKAEPTQSSDTWNNPFTDVISGAWYYDAVKFVDENHLMSGYGNGIFAPNSNLSRAMLAQILYSKEGQPSITSSNIFTDVSNEMWYTNAVTWAEANGFVSGYGNNLFGPNDSITREQLAMILWRYTGSPFTENVELHFSDSSNVSNYAKSALCWATENGIISGKGNNILDPKGKATRAEVAAMIMRFCEMGQF